MENRKINVRGLDFDDVTLDEAAEIVASRLEKADGEPFSVFTPNAEILQLCIEHNKYYELFRSASMLIPDGIGVVKASKILGTPLRARVPGVELGERTIQIAAEKGYKVYFLGGKPGVAELAAKKMSEKYPGLCIAGTADGYFKKAGEESDAEVKKIVASRADILFVCLGVPAQEKWIYENKKSLHGVKVCLALGGSLDVYSGTVKRAPAFFCRTGLEWLYRLLCEPKRIGRMLKLPKFLFGTYACRHKTRKNDR
ncbi:MAG: WecB/TagA/CpsF family glycosyltransferase [Eubacteriales bacterium]